MSFTCDVIQEPTLRAKLERIAKIRSLVATYCLPNTHRKDGLESPPQFVAATRGTIVPMLSAPAMNCGMSVFTTTLSKEDFSEDFLKTFAANLRHDVAPRKSRTQAILQWLGILEPASQQYDLSKKELEDIFIHGARAAIKKYNLLEQELDRIEYRGCIFDEAEKKNINLKNLVPRSSYTNGRHEMGYNFGGNHFLEIHYVEKIVDQGRAENLGIRENQILMFYHGGGGHATYHLGRYFARREKNTRAEKAALFVLKLLFHFSSWEGVKNFRARWQAYFSRHPFPEIPADSPEGRRLMQSIKIGLNYGYAFRVALLRRINDALPAPVRAGRQAGLPHGSASFFWDAAHNSIMEEREFIVHRQDAMRVFPGKPVMISGFNNTLSYIGIGAQGAEKTLWSATPSAAKTIEKYLTEKRSAIETPSHRTFISKRKNPELEIKEHVTSEGLFDVVQSLEKEDIIKPVAYIRPLGVIKGH